MSTEPTETPMSTDLVPVEPRPSGAMAALNRIVAAVTGAAGRAGAALAGLWGGLRDSVAAAGRRAAHPFRSEKLPVAVSGDAPYRPERNLLKRLLARVPTNGLLLASAVGVWGAVYVIFLL